MNVQELRGRVSGSYGSSKEMAQLKERVTTLRDKNTQTKLDARKQAVASQWDLDGDEDGNELGSTGEWDLRGNLHPVQPVHPVRTGYGSTGTGYSTGYGNQRVGAPVGAPRSSNTRTGYASAPEPDWWESLDA